MERIVVRPIWAWACPDCTIVNLMTTAPEVNEEVACGEPWSDGEHGCGCIYAIGEISPVPVVATHSVINVEEHLIGMPGGS
jgi:hypothetical protein